MLSEFGPGTDLAKRLRKLEDAVGNLSTRDVLQNASIDGGGITVDGGEIHVINGGSIVVDSGGTITLPGGAFSSGSVTTNALTVNGNETVTGTSSSGAVSTGTVTASGNVSSSGQVSSNGSPFQSQPSYGYHVATSYQAMWIDGATYQLGISASSEKVKTDLAAMTADDARRLLNLTPYWGRYVWDDPTSPLKVFFLAADVQAAGFGPDVAVTAAEPINMLMPDGSPVVDSSGNDVVIPVGEAYSINYSQLVVPLIAAWHDGAAQMQSMQATVQTQAAQIAALEARLTAAGIA